MNENKNERLTRMEILSNAGALQTLLHSVCKSVSQTEGEFNVKYDIFQRMTQTYHKWGYGGQIVALLSLTAYCVKGYNAKVKLLGGVLYIYWINHFFSVSSFVGMSLKLNWAYNQLYQLPQDSETGKQLLIIEELVRRRRDQSDSELSNQFYKLTMKTEVKEQKEDSLVQNDFFVKHKEYVPQMQNNEIRFPIKQLDCYLTRYPYFSFKRWCERVSELIGISK